MAGLDVDNSHHGETLHPRKSMRPYNIMVILAMGFGSIAMGYSGSVIGSTLAQPTFIEYFDFATRPNGTSLISAMNGLFQAGAFFGAICISWVADAWGRKTSISVAAFLVVLSGALLAGSVHIAMFLVFRFFAGMGSFWLLGAIPIWMTEIVPARNRGLLVDIHSAALLFGYTFAGWMGFGFYHVGSKNAWRAPLAIQALPGLIVLLAMPWLPESPRYLIQKGKHEEARRVLGRLHESEEARIEYAQIEAQLNHDMSLPHSWKSLLTKKTYRKRALFAVGLACGIQFTGVLVINSKSRFISTHQNTRPCSLTSGDRLWIYHLLWSGLRRDRPAVVQRLVQHRRLGMWHGGHLHHRPLPEKQARFLRVGLCDDMFGGGSGPGGQLSRWSEPEQRRLEGCRGHDLSLHCESSSSVLTRPPYPLANQRHRQAFAQLFLDGTQYVYYAEMFPQHLRAKGMTLGMGAISLMNVMWLQVAPTAFEKISWKFYLCFIIPAYLFAIVCLFFYPNTKGLALEEIAALFGDEVQAEVYQVAQEVHIVDHEKGSDVLTDQEHREMI